MPHVIKVHAGAVSAEAELNDSPTAAALWNALPFSARANTWGDEIYFSVPVDQKLDSTAAETVEMGDLGYWPTGKAFCIFFGPTPMSSGNKIRPASAVNVIGKVRGDARIFKSVKDGEKVELTSKQ